MGKRADLVAVYMEALEARPVLVLTSPTGRPSRLSFEPVKNLDIAEAIWFAKPHHAELVLMHAHDDLNSIGALRPQGWIDLTANELRDTVINVAGNLGASWQTTAETRRRAETAVNEITTRVEASRQNGSLTQVNAAYKVYRQGQIAKGEKAVPYSGYLADFTRSLVVFAAKNAL